MFSMSPPHLKPFGLKIEGVGVPAREAEGNPDLLRGVILEAYIVVSSH